MLADIGAIFILVVIGAVPLVGFWVLAERKHWDVKLNYRIGSYFYRLRYNRRLAKRQYHRSAAQEKVPSGTYRPAPESVTKMSAEEDRFFFLHEVQLDTNVPLVIEDQTKVRVSRRHYRKLEEYFGLHTSRRATPAEAFGHYGMTVEVAKKR